MRRIRQRNGKPDTNGENRKEEEGEDTADGSGGGQGCRGIKQKNRLKYFFLKYHLKSWKAVGFYTSRGVSSKIFFLNPHLKRLTNVIQK